MCAGDSSDDAHGEHWKWCEHHPVSGTHDRGRQDQGGGGTYTFTCISTRSPPDKIPSGQNPLQQRETPLLILAGIRHRPLHVMDLLKYEVNYVRIC